MPIRLLEEGGAGGDGGGGGGEEEGGEGGERGGGGEGRSTRPNRRSLSGLRCVSISFASVVRITYSRRDQLGDHLDGVDQLPLGGLDERITGHSHRTTRHNPLQMLALRLY